MKSTVIPFGQELNPETYATCKSDMILKGNTNSQIVLGNSFSEDGFGRKENGEPRTFDYMLSNPPFGVEWRKVERIVKDEHSTQGFNGRFGAGTPRISDGSLLFLQHMISKMTPPEKGGSRIGIVFNGSPLFTGDAGSGESEIRRWIIENDLLEGIVALPDQLFYNTGISTYVWILTNRKTDRRKGKIRLVNGVSYFEKMRKALGNKRNQISEQNRQDLVKLYYMYETHEDYKDFDNEDFGYYKITVERPLRLDYSTAEERLKSLSETDTFIYGNTNDDESAPPFYIKLSEALREVDQTKVFLNKNDFADEVQKTLSKHNIDMAGRVEALLSCLCQTNADADIVTDKKGNPVADTSLRDTETIPLKEDIQEYFGREVLPHIPDAWIDESKTKIGYEIPFTRHFYKFTALRNSLEIMEEIKALEQKIKTSLKGVLEE